MEKINEMKSVFSDVSPDQHFVLQGGKSLKNLDDLIAALKTMQDDVFMHHVNDDRNDFSSWIEHAMGDKELADLIAKAKTRHAAIGMIKEKARSLRTVSKKENNTPKVTAFTVKKEVIVKKDTVSPIPKKQNPIDAKKRSKELEKSVPLTTIKIPKKAVSKKTSVKKAAKKPAVKKANPRKKKASAPLAKPVVSEIKVIEKTVADISAGVREYAFGIVVGLAIGIFVGLLL